MADKLIQGIEIKHKRFLLPGVILLITAVAVFSYQLCKSPGKAQEGIPQTQDARDIQEVIQKSYDLEGMAGRTFDTSSFKDVFINDPRFELDPSTVKFITDVTHEPIKDKYGYLDYKLAYFNWWKEGAEKLEEYWAKAKEEGRQTFTEEETKSLVDENFRAAAPRLQGDFEPNVLHFFSIDIHDDIAAATFDDGPRTVKMTLVKVKDRWLIAGATFLSIHP
jgi:hypothetical protein